MRKYTVGINVTHVDELTDMAPKVKTFLDVLGDGDLDLQLAINPRGDDHGFVANVIGFVRTIANMTRKRITRSSTMMKRRMTND